jgi:xanthine dehydrogenase YagS FAD-binding subunit
MKAFNYLVADNVEAALAEYAGGGAKLKAGGIDLLDQMKERVETPEAVLSVGGIEALRYIRTDGDGLRIGSNATLADIERHAVIRERFAALRTAAGEAATPQVRERATAGGNLCQRPRCWYYRSADFPCLKKMGATCYSVEGENEYHAVFGDGPCHIVHPSNIAPSLLAVDAVITVRNAEGERPVKAREFFVMPNKSLYAENVLKPDEMVTEIHIPKLPEMSATVELREKQSFDWPLAMASVARVDGAWQVCLGAVAPVPWLSEPAMAVLGSNGLTPELAARAATAAVQGAQPMRDNAYKIQLVMTAVKRALLAAAGMEATA